MSKADKKRIEELLKELRIERERVSSWQSNYFGIEKTVDELREEVQQEKENYASLLERYISLMERLGMLDGRKETD
jgi:coenzyme F420-reducing hydrogenase delta subunit